MASLQIGHGATTLHHWAGILDGRHTYEKLAELFDNDDQFSNAKKRIEEADTLIIDEISMLSLKVFEMVEFVCRHVKKNTKIFGGIQVIGCGDFKQLPPVPNRRYDDHGAYCFESDKFNLSFPHHINLIEVIVLSGSMSAKLDKSDNWINAYTKLNEFVLSDKHILSIQKLFKVNNINKYQNKLSSKIVFWLMNKEIEKKAKAVTAKQITDIEAETSIEEELSSAGKSKIRYLTGACVQKITKRLKESVLRKMGQSTKKSKLAMRMDYKKQCLLKQFRISELDVADNDESMVEIDFKQGPSRGLTIPNDSVFNFFLSLHSVLQHKLSLKQMHLYLEDLHNHCRNAVDNDDVLIGKWISLFDIQDDGKIEDELFLTLIMELYRDVTEHFIRISFVDSLKYFKRTIPRKKKQALRTKIQALGDSRKGGYKIVSSQENWDMTLPHKIQQNVWLFHHKNLGHAVATFWDITGEKEVSRKEDIK
ncbi:Hypothetical predicted protein [Mytilus galloprovincialis]|nr:Hypothetical predicted protein [Mytilus galloprovincialis]